MLIMRTIVIIKLESRMKIKENKLRIKLMTILIGICITACGHKKNDGKMSKETEISIVKKCLVRLDSVRPNGYLVSPRFEKFEFSSFPDGDNHHERYNYKKNKPEILKTLGWTNNDFVEIQKTVDKEYLKKANPELLKLSKSKMHNEVVLFSGINENLVFVNIVDYCNAVKNSELASASFDKNQRFSSVAYYIFVLKDGNVQKIMLDGVRTKEMQCNDSDVRVDE